MEATRRQEPEAEAQKRKAAIRAADWIEDGMTLGLGTGSTVRHLLDHIADMRAQGRWTNLVGVPTSEQTARRATDLGIPLATLDDRPEIDLTLDGADEADPELRLIKGLGGALLREKVVAAASRRLVIMVDGSKEVERLGARAPLPVEVDPFSTSIQYRFLKDLGCEPRLRGGEGGSPFVTDGGNWIIDCRFRDGIADPEALEVKLNNRPGVVENGLFLGMATAVVIAGGEGIRVLESGRGAE